MKRNKTIWVLAMSAVMTWMPSIGAAQATYTLNMPAQPLAEALKALGKSTATNIMIDPSLVKDIQAPALKGVLTADQALAKVLAGTALSYRFIDERTVTIRRNAGNGADASPAEQMRVAMADGQDGKEQGLAESADSPDGKNQITVRDTKVSRKPYVDGNLDTPRTVNDVQAYYIFDSQTIAESGTKDVEEFLRQRLTMDTTIQSNSRTTLQQMSATRGMNTEWTANTASSFNLNGLGTDRTLILVNGAPRPGASVYSYGAVQPGQPDVNGIPLGAIDRIEVLPSSAGAIYGGGAEGGVINIILKRNFTGGEAKANYGSTWDGHGSSRSIEFTAGKSFGKNQVLVTAQYASDSPMILDDRIDVYQRGYAALLENSPGFVGLNPAYMGYGALGSLPNIMTFQGPLTLKSTGQSLGANYTFIPAGTSTATPMETRDLGLLENAGRLSLAPGKHDQAPNGLEVPLGNYPRRKSLMATVGREITAKIRVHADLSYSENHADSSFNPIATSYPVPASVPANPFNQAVYITFPVDFGGAATSDTVTKSVAVGGTIDLSRGWIAHLDYQWSESSIESRFSSGLSFGTFQSTPAFGSYFGVPDPHPTPLFTGAVNPFVDTLANPIDWTPFTFDYHSTGKTRSTNIDFGASGPLFQLPWGAPQLTVRLEHNKSGQPEGSTNSTAPTATPYLGLGLQWGTYYSFEQTQTVDSARTELDLPIFKSRLPLLRSLDAQGNFSYTRTSVTTGTPGMQFFDPYPYNYYNPANDYPTNPRFLRPTLPNGEPYRSRAVNSHTGFTGPAFSYRPFDEVMIRASVATGYLPPTYSQLLPDLSAAGSQGETVNDPRTGASTTGVTVFYVGGNPDLKPNTSKSRNIGIVWEPKTGPFRGLRANVEFSETRQNNLILDPGPQGIVNLEAYYPDLVVRNSSGQITAVYDKYINVAEARQESWTFSLDYGWQWPIGRFDLTASTSVQERNERQIVAGTRFLDYVGYPSAGGNAKTKAAYTLRWANSIWVAAGSAVYFGGYNQAGAPGDPAFYSYELQEGAPYTLNTYFLNAQGSYTIPSQAYYNIYLSYSFGEDAVLSRLRGLLKGTKVSLAVNNVLNTLPPFDAYYAPFYASPYGDIRLRAFSLSLTKAF
jgi:iron complex outermembrane receptor protein